MSKISLGKNFKSYPSLLYQGSYQARCCWLWKYLNRSSSRKQICTLRLGSIRRNYWKQ